MPFTKSYQVANEFFNVFLRHTTMKQAIPNFSKPVPMLPVEVLTGEEVDFLVKYYKRSGESGVEEMPEFYPCFVIQDFIPEVDKSIVWGKDWIEGAIDEVNKVRDYITLPVPLIFRYQVSVVSKRDREHRGAFDWFLEHFNLQRTDFLEFNAIQTPNDGIVADIVPYSCTQTEVPRDDNRFEFAFDFTLKTFVHAKKPRQMDYLEQITVYLKTQNYPELANFFVTETVIK